MEFDVLQPAMRITNMSVRNCENGCFPAIRFIKWSTHAPR